MSKSIRSFPEVERDAVANRRLKGATKGLGYWSAVKYFERKERKNK